MFLSVFSSHGLKDLTPSSLVHGPLLKWKPVVNYVSRSGLQRGHAPYGEVLLHGRWSSHQSPLFLLCSSFKGNTGQSGKPHSQTLQFAKGLWEAGIHLCVVKTLSGILQKHIHVNKQAVGKVPKLSCSKRFCFWWVYIMIQIKILQTSQMVIII